MFVCVCEGGGGVDVGGHVIAMCYHGNENFPRFPVSEALIAPCAGRLFIGKLNKPKLYSPWLSEQTKSQSYNQQTTQVTPSFRGNSKQWQFSLGERCNPDYQRRRRHGIHLKRTVSTINND